MKTAKISISSVENIAYYLFKGFGAGINEIRDNIARRQRDARGRARLAMLNEHLLRDVGIDQSSAPGREIDRSWML